MTTPLSPEGYKNVIKQSRIDLKELVAEARGRYGRDFIRGLPQGKLLDALDAGRENGFPTDGLVDQIEASLVEHVEVGQHFVILAGDHKLGVHPRTPEVKALVDVNAEEVRVAVDSLQGEPNGPHTARKLMDLMEAMYQSLKTAKADGS